MENATEILIQWDMIDKKYKHVRMDMNKQVYVYILVPKINELSSTWVGNKADFRNINSLIKYDTSKLDWITFKATRPTEEIKVETKKLIIQWHFIANKFKHVRKFKDERFIVFEHAPYISDDTWVSLVGTCRNITDLVTGDILELDWKTFEANRGEDVKMETKKVYYTQEMKDAGVLPKVGDECMWECGQHKDRKIKILAISFGFHWILVDGHNLPDTIGNISGLYPIDQRTDEEKLIDDVADFLIEIDDDSIFIDRDAALDIASDLFESSKFTIIKKGD